MAFNSWHSIHGIQFMAFNSSHSIHGIQFMAFNSWHSIFGIPFMAFMALYSHFCIYHFKCYHHLNNVHICTSTNYIPQPLSIHSQLNVVSLTTKEHDLDSNLFKLISETNHIVSYSYIIATQSSCINTSIILH